MRGEEKPELMQNTHIVGFVDSVWIQLIQHPGWTIKTLTQSPRLGKQNIPQSLKVVSYTPYTDNIHPLWCFTVKITSMYYNELQFTSIVRGYVQT